MRTTMKVLAAVVLFTAACGGAPYSTTSAWDGRYALAGHWMLETGTTPADAAIVGLMDIAGDLASGTYTESSPGRVTTITRSLTAHTFSPSSPDFSLTFGDHTISGKLLAESNSNVFQGSIGTLAVTGVVTSR